MSDNQYFTWQNIGELTSLKEHIEFAQTILEQGAPGQEQDYLKSQLDKIIQKQKDVKLNISVIGEFSSGKSTFINALLRQELLQACVLQGTTVASTIIEHGNKYKIEIHEEEKETCVLHFRTLDKLKEKLNQLVAENDHAKQLTEVLVRLPARMLEYSKLRIIDTPGLEATVSWHEQKTIQTLEEVSDLSIILVDATRPLPESLCEFVETYLQNVLNQCVFLVTKIDMIRERERNMLLTYIGKMIEEKLGVAEPTVLPYASLEVINSFAPGSYTPSKCQNDLEISLTSEKKILEHTAKQRTIAQTRKLAALLVRLYDHLSKRLEKMTAKEEDRLALLKQTAQIDLKTYVAEQQRLSEQWYDSQSACILRTVQGHKPKWVSEYVQKVLNHIQGCSTEYEVDEYVNGKILGDCQKYGRELANLLIQDANGNKGLRLAFKSVMNRFNGDFKEHFKKLKCLVPESRNEILTMQNIGVPDVNKISLARNYTNDMVRTGNRRFWGGVAAGAAAGSVIPGLGTVAGAVLGGVAGLVAGPRVDTVREETKSRLSGPLTKYFEDVADMTYEKILEYNSSVRGQIETEMNRYLNAYLKTVNDTIKKEESQQKNQIEKIETLKGQMRELDIRQKQLKSVLSQIQLK